MPKIKTHKGATKRGYVPKKKKLNKKNPYITKSMREAQTMEKQVEEV